ncbi:hypothetical protein EVAR_91045_1 [Eumeta japonica]|uniref:Uncharacterized protein n=1 Tax=Eumeta variegata TaxID=151549 RepID=A0A4C1Z7S8_EUMVA|nr:hypothetical protein EVAR_91045_1 [Eumeta japonica]
MSLTLHGGRDRRRGKLVLASGDTFETGHLRFAETQSRVSTHEPPGLNVTPAFAQYLSVFRDEAVDDSVIGAPPARSKGRGSDLDESCNSRPSSLTLTKQVVQWTSLSWSENVYDEGVMKLLPKRCEGGNSRKSSILINKSPQVKSDDKGPAPRPPNSRENVKQTVPELIPRAHMYR